MKTYKGFITEKKKNFIAFEHDGGVVAITGSEKELQSVTNAFDNSFTKKWLDDYDPKTAMVVKAKDWLKIK